MSRLDRVERIEGWLPRPRELNVGEGRTIVTTMEDRLAMLLAAINGDDHPMLDAVRSGTGAPDSDEFARLLQALIVEAKPPSGNPEEPWIDDEEA